MLCAAKKTAHKMAKACLHEHEKVSTRGEMTTIVIYSCGTDRKRDNSFTGNRKTHANNLLSISMKSLLYYPY